MYSNVSFLYDNKANMPAQTNATINQNMNDRQPDIESKSLSMIFITKTKGIRLTQAYPPFT